MFAKKFFVLFPLFLGWVALGQIGFAALWGFASPPSWGSTGTGALCALVAALGLAWSKIGDRGGPADGWRADGTLMAWEEAAYRLGQSTDPNFGYIWQDKTTRKWTAFASHKHVMTVDDSPNALEMCKSLVEKAIQRK